jgi:two-component system, response regulator / RNA-binding antiterminator
MLNVLLVESTFNNTLLEYALKCQGFDFLKIQHSPLFITLTKESRPDVIIFNIDTPSEQLITDLHRLNQQLPLPIIMFANDGSTETINKVINAEVSTYIVDGLTGSRLNSIIDVTLARFKQRQALKDKLDAARTLLEDRKQIDRAKGILIKARNFSEDEAYHTLRKLAMDRNITLGAMAKNVIAMAELLK